MIHSLFALLLAAPALAAEPAPQSEGLPPEIGAVVDAAAAEGLPADVLSEKAREGLAKNVDAARIVPVLEDLKTDLERMDHVLGDVARGDDRADVLMAAGAASREGASAGTILRVATDAKENRVAALWGLADLMRSGVDEAGSVALLETVLRSSQPALGLRGLASTAATLLGSGLSPKEVVADVSAAVQTTGSPLSAVPGDQGRHGEHPDNGVGNGASHPNNGNNGTNGNNGNAGDHDKPSGKRGGV